MSWETHLQGEAGGSAPAAGATPAGGPATPPPQLLPQLRQRKKNLRRLLMTWALVFLHKPPL